MATIAKFYLHDAASPNTGTMPSTSPCAVQGLTATGDVTGATTARAADDTIGTLQKSSTATALANTTTQNWGHRRFVSSPLAARTIAAADGNWTWSYARSESALNHNATFFLGVWVWRPGTGAQVGTNANSARVQGTEPGTSEAVEAFTNSIGWGTTLAISDGDILVFDICVSFTQSKSSLFTDSFFYDGTTEASASSCASFVAPPVAYTLFGAAAAGIPDVGMGLRVT